jgi:hypothetical protein
VKILEIPSYECPRCASSLMIIPQNVSEQMTHVVLEHQYHRNCEFSGKWLRVPVHLVEGELVAKEGEYAESPTA